MFAPHYTSCLLTLKFKSLDPHLENSRRFESLYLIRAVPFELFIVLVGKSCRMTFLRLLKRMQETVENTNIALDNVQKPERQVERIVVCSSVLRKESA